MSKTILITGASSGIGKATAKYFNGKGWNVVATMRSPDKVKDLEESDSLKKFALDVTDDESIAKAVAAGLKEFKTIDVLLNNAGFAVFGPMESVSEEVIQQQFAVNVFGMIRVSKAVLPHFRAKKSGRIINISSMAGRITFPLVSMYNSSKFAVEGLSESLNYELNPLGIDVKLVEPGAVRTAIYGKSMAGIDNEITEYNTIISQIEKSFDNASDGMFPSTPEDMAKTIYKAATTKSRRMRYLSGRDAKMLVFLRNVLGVNMYMWCIKKLYKI